MSKRSNGEGTIYKHKSGMWCAQYSHKEKRYSVYAKTQAAVKAKLKEAISKIDSGIDPKNEKLTFAEWLNHWLEVYAKPVVKTSTYVGYETAARLHIIPSIGKVKMCSLTTGVFQEFFNEKSAAGRADGKDGGLSAKTLRNIYNMLHLCLKSTVNDGIIVKNVIENVRLPKCDIKEERVLSIEEQDKLISAARTDKNISTFGIILLLFTGMRRGELLALQWRDVNFEKRSVLVSKTLNRLPDYSESGAKTKIVIGTAKTSTSRREIPLLDRIFEELLLYKERQKKAMAAKGLLQTEDTYIIANRNFSVFEPKGFDNLVKRIERDSGIKSANIHSFRHTFATRCIESGMDILVVSHILGHAQASTTLNKYGHCLPDHKRDCIGKLDGLYLKNAKEDNING